MDIHNVIQMIQLKLLYSKIAISRANPYELPTNMSSGGAFNKYQITLFCITCNL